MFCRAPSAVKATATCYIELIVKESDNNVKLIVLDRLVAMAETHEKVSYLLLLLYVSVSSLYGDSSGTHSMFVFES